MLACYFIIRAYVIIMTFYVKPKHDFFFLMCHTCSIHRMSEMTVNNLEEYFCPRGSRGCYQYASAHINRMKLLERKQHELQSVRMGVSDYRIQCVYIIIPRFLLFILFCFSQNVLLPLLMCKLLSVTLFRISANIFDSDESQN